MEHDLDEAARAVLGKLLADPEMRKVIQQTIFQINARERQKKQETKTRSWLVKERELRIESTKRKIPLVRRLLAGETAKAIGESLEKPVTNTTILQKASHVCRVVHYFAARNNYEQPWRKDGRLPEATDTIREMRQEKEDWFELFSYWEDNH